MISSIHNQSRSGSGIVSGAVAKIIPFSNVDGPGNRFAIFFQGCDFACKYCHNPETRPFYKVSGGKDSGFPRTMTLDEICTLIEPVRPFIRGVTLSGGEVLVQGEFAGAIMNSMSREFRLGTLIDTCGSRDFSPLKHILHLSEGIMLDVKAWDDKEHRDLTGQSNTTVLKNFHWALEHRLLTEVRTVITPELVDCKQTVVQVARILAQAKSGIPYVLIPFRPQGVQEPWNKLGQPNREYMEELLVLGHSEGHRNIVLR